MFPPNCREKCIDCPLIRAEEITKKDYIEEDLNALFELAVELRTRETCYRIHRERIEEYISEMLGKTTTVSS